LRLPNGLRGFATDATNSNERFRASTIGAIHFFSSQSQYRLKEPALGISNRKLGRVNPYREPPGPSGNIVASECSLAALIQTPLRRESERVGRNHRASRQNLPNPRIQFFRHAVPRELGP